VFYVWLSKFVTGKKGVVFETAVILLYFTEVLWSRFRPKLDYSLYLPRIERLK